MKCHNSASHDSTGRLLRRSQHGRRSAETIFHHYIQIPLEIFPSTAFTPTRGSFRVFSRNVSPEPQHSTMISGPTGHFGHHHEDQFCHHDERAGYIDALFARERNYILLQIQLYKSDCPRTRQTGPAHKSQWSTHPALPRWLPRLNLNYLVDYRPGWSPFEQQPWALPKASKPCHPWSLRASSLESPKALRSRGSITKLKVRSGTSS